MWDKAVKGDTGMSPRSGPSPRTGRGCCLPQPPGCRAGCKGHPIGEGLLLGMSAHQEGPSTMSQKEQITVINSISFG